MDLLPHSRNSHFSHLHFFKATLRPYSDMKPKHCPLPPPVRSVNWTLAFREMSITAPSEFCKGPSWKSVWKPPSLEGCPPKHCSHFWAENCAKEETKYRSTLVRLIPLQVQRPRSYYLIKSYGRPFFSIDPWSSGYPFWSDRNMLQQTLRQKAET